jgi:hypothetical protein
LRDFEHLRAFLGKTAALGVLFAIFFWIGAGDILLSRLTSVFGPMTTFLEWSWHNYLRQFGYLFNTLPRVFTVLPQSSYGPMGWALFPFSVFVIGGFFLSILRSPFGRGSNSNIVLACIFTVFVFFFGLSAMESLTGLEFRIRFRTPAVPLLIVLAVVAFKETLEELKEYRESRVDIRAAEHQ